MLDSLSSIVKFLGIIVVTYTLYVISSGIGLDPLGYKWDFSISGQFGDSFGPLNTFMAAIAAVGAIAAYHSQREELVRVRENSFQEQERTNKRDFENTFFNLLGLFRETVKEIDIPGPYGQKSLMGRDALKCFLEKWVGNPIGNDTEDRSSYKIAFEEQRDDLGHYFRIFYHILKFINDSTIKDKKLYSGILRATLSETEIVIISLNCIYGGGYPN